MNAFVFHVVEGDQPYLDDARPHQIVLGDTVIYELPVEWDDDSSDAMRRFALRLREVLAND